MPKSCIKEHTVFIKRERPEHPDNDEDVLVTLKILSFITE